MQQQPFAVGDRGFDRSALEWMLDRARKSPVDVHAGTTTAAAAAARWKAERGRIEAAYAALFVPARRGEQVSFTATNVANFVDGLSLEDVLAIGGDVDEHDDLNEGDVDGDEDTSGGA
jgi:hypothetical protein